MAIISRRSFMSAILSSPALIASSAVASSENKRELIATCRVEGGEYTPDKDYNNPIRFYSDGTVEDDFLFSMGYPRIREIYSKERVSLIKAEAEFNRSIGKV